MNRLQYLLTKLAEEATEVAQIALKSQQFGLDERKENDATQPTNKERIHAEINDLLGVIDMLNSEYGFNYNPNTIDNLYARANKITKVDKYYEYAKKLGNVT